MHIIIWIYKKKQLTNIYNVNTATVKQSLLVFMIRVLISWPQLPSDAFEASGVQVLKPHLDIYISAESNLIAFPICAFAAQTIMVQHSLADGILTSANLSLALIRLCRLFCDLVLTATHQQMWLVDLWVCYWTLWYEGSLSQVLADSGSIEIGYVCFDWPLLL